MSAKVTLNDGQTVATLTPSETTDVSYVTLFADGRVAYCGCLGWHFRQTCKHSQALGMLVAHLYLEGVGACDASN